MLHSPSAILAVVAKSLETQSTSSENQCFCKENGKWIERRS